MAEHHKLTHDEQWLRRVALQLVKGCNWIIRERSYFYSALHRPDFLLLFSRSLCFHGLQPNTSCARPNAKW